MNDIPAPTIIITPAGLSHHIGRRTTGFKESFDCVALSTVGDNITSPLRRASNKLGSPQNEANISVYRYKRTI